MITEEFIQKAQAIHGDKYDYSKVEYINHSTKVCILCPKHGEFWQIPYKHLHGQGCKECGRASLAKQFSQGRDKFIERANIVHQGRYDYSEVKYVNSHTHVKIICPQHGIFTQTPASHLRGNGCPTCADIMNGERHRIWTDETCYLEAQKYNSKLEFRKGNSGAYAYATKKRLFDRFDWFEEIKKPNGYWTRKRCEEESHKYTSKKEFLKGCPAAHSAAARNGWLDEFTWLVNQRIDVINDKIDSVYVYVFEETKAAYVGRTLIRRQKKRDKEHIFNQDGDSVARYAKKHHIPVPPMTILESKLTLEEGQAREDYWRRWYEEQGYTMLNRIATGIGKGSLGAIGQGKWNRRTCREEALKYKSASEFENANASAYTAARRNGWIKDYTWFVKLWEPKWSKEACAKEAKKYKTRSEFQKGNSVAYGKALSKGWIDEYYWMTSRLQKPMGYWDNYDHCFEEARKYKNRRQFQKGCGGAYEKASKNGWLDDYTWFQGNKMNYWNRETCYEEAKKYKTISDFAKKAVRAYELSRKNGWDKDYTWFEKPFRWNYETCKAEAQKYSKRSHFKAGCPGAYTKSRINGWLEEFFSN